MADTKEVVLTAGDKEYKLTEEFIEMKQKELTINEEKYTPHVIEPSFGIGRIIYCIFEHCFKVRADNA
jgi:glycyl-tRNA synthetase